MPQLAHAIDGLLNFALTRQNNSLKYPAPKTGMQA